ncbi:MAG: alpha/beta fold hydrolase [Pseudomonadota bacterium]
MPQAALGDITLHYEREGNGTPLIAVAGMVSDSASWGPLVPGLASSFDLIRPDNRCTGQTRPLPCATSIAAMVDDCIGLLDALDIDTAHFLGHSMGAAICLHLAARHPGRVGRVVAMSGTGTGSAHARAVFTEIAALADDHEDPGRFLRLLFPWLFSPAFFDQPGAVEAAEIAALAYPHRQPLAGMQGQMALLHQPAPPLDVTAIEAPLLVIGGEEDRLVPPHSLQAAFADTIWQTHSRPAVTILRGAGHSVHWDAPEAVLACILDFLTAER